MKKGWQTKRIGDVCDLATGGTPSRAKPEYFGGDIKWLVSGDINQGEIFDCEGRITEAGKKNSNAKLLPVNSVMIALNGQGKTRGTVALLRTQATCNQSMVSITPKQSSGLLPEFLYANLHGRYEEIRRMTSDDDKDRRGLNMGLVRSIEIPIAPLAEQQRIVGLLDEAFEGLATAKANAEKNLQNARALFESHLQSVFTQRGPGWVEKRLGDVFTTATGTTPPKNNPDFYGDFMPLVKPPELCDEAFDSAPDGLSEAGAAVARTLPAKSILVSCIGNLGKIGLNIVPVAFNQQINAILPDESQAIPEFMFFQSLSPGFKSQLESLASGTTVPIVNKSKFNSVSVVLPPLSIQKPVVAQFSSLREETQHHAGFYEQKHAALAALKKSLLHQAFTGEL